MSEEFDIDESSTASTDDSRVPILSWDDEDAEIEQSFFGGTPAAYSDYIEDSPAYEPEPSIYLEESSPAPSDRGDLWRIVAIVAAVVVSLIIVYVLGVRRFSNRFLPNTLINGYNVAGLTVEEAQQALEQQTKDYSCVISVDDFSTEVKGADIGIERNEEHVSQLSMQDQSAFFWPVALIVPRPIEVDAEVKFDEGAAKSIVVKAVEDHNEQTLPTDEAHITFDESIGLYKVSGSTEGTALDADAVAKDAINSIRLFATQCDPSSENVTHQATVADIPSYAHTAENANRARNSDVSITVDGESVIISDADQNASWITVESGPTVVVDKEALRFWAQSYVADAVYHSDDWSNYYLNEDAFVDEFAKRLSDGVVDPFEAPTIDELRTEGESRERAYEKGGWNSELGRYIDVDLESQFARLFDEKGEVIWESAFVSGSMYEGRSTVTGEFEIYSMQTNTVLVGMDYNGDGQPDYESFVNYWMPFYGGYGLHDATWRANFGGENYYYGGSHGCVNLPYSKAEELFGITHVGEKVIVHW